MLLLLFPGFFSLEIVLYSGDSGLDRGLLPVTWGKAAGHLSEALRKVGWSAGS